MLNQNYWRRCSICKDEIKFSTTYYLCSVSSCTKKRSPVQFCSVSCWDSHNAVLNHMSAGADEYTSPTKAQWESENQEGESPRRRIVSSPPKSTRMGSSDNQEILVVVSKLKAYIQSQSGMSTSADVMPMLSDIIRQEADKAIENAKRAGRKTVMARDF